MNGEWIWALNDGPAKIKRFSQYFMFMKNYTLLVLNFTQEDIKIAIDNATIHISEKAKNAKSYLKLQIYWLP